LRADHAAAIAVTAAIVDDGALAQFFTEHVLE
jgi:hypothetical protein